MIGLTAKKVYVAREQKYSQAVIFAEFILAILTLNRESKFSKIKEIDSIAKFCSAKFIPPAPVFFLCAIVKFEGCARRTK